MKFTKGEIEAIVTGLIEIQRDVTVHEDAKKDAEMATVLTNTTTAMKKLKGADAIDGDLILVSETMIEDMLKLIHELSCQVEWAKTSADRVASKARLHAEDIESERDRLTPKANVDELCNRAHATIGGDE